MTDRIMVWGKSYGRLHWFSGQPVRMQCDRTQVRISPWMIVFSSMATAICSLGHGLRLTAVPIGQLSLASHGGR